jgi:hypothetical protein
MDCCWGLVLDNLFQIFLEFYTKIIFYVRKEKEIQKKSFLTPSMFFIIDNSLKEWPIIYDIVISIPIRSYTFTFWLIIIKSWSSYTNLLDFHRLLVLQINKNHIQFFLIWIWYIYYHLTIFLFYIYARAHTTVLTP